MTKEKTASFCNLLEGGWSGGWGTRGGGSFKWWSRGRVQMGLDTNKQPHSTPPHPPHTQGGCAGLIMPRCTYLKVISREAVRPHTHTHARTHTREYVGGGEGLLWVVVGVCVC